MLSLIEVKCPHCGAQGQIMLPPLGSIIVGPCPECHEMVVVFCGKVMALDKNIMSHGSTEEKQEHLLEVLGVFLQERIERLFSAEAAHPARAEAEGHGEAEEAEEHHHESGAEQDAGSAIRPRVRGPILEPITPEEIRAFVNVDLRMLDNREYFRAIFDKSSS
jgi:hypothetical protein